MKLPKFIAGLGLAAMLFTSCQKELLEPSKPVSDTTVVTVPPRDTTIVTPPVVRKDTVVFNMRTFALDENTTGAFSNVFGEQLPIDHNIVPINERFKAATNVAGTAKVQIVPRNNRQPNSTMNIGLGTFLKYWENGFDVNANYANPSMDMDVYISNNDGSKITQSVYTDPNSGVRDTISGHVVKIQIKDNFDNELLSGPNPLLSGDTLTRNINIAQPSKLVQNINGVPRIFSLN